jgi:hypothetical protein
MAPRRPDPAVLFALDTLLRSRHRGAENAVTGARLLVELAEYNFLGLHLRRISEAVRELRRSGAPIASDSAAGYWYEPDPLAYQQAIRGEMVPRLRAMAEDLRFADRTLYDALSLALNLGGTA